MVVSLLVEGGASLNTEDNWWRIADFTSEIERLMQNQYDDDSISMHTNTIDRWFKDLEKKGIHYVTRSQSGQRIYNSEIDLKIGMFIAAYRHEEDKKNKFSLDGVYHLLEQQLETRPFPDGDDTNIERLRETADASDIKEMMYELLPELIHEIKQELKIELSQEIKQEIQSDIQKALPPAPDEAELRANKIDEFITRGRIELQLRDEAIKAWNQKPSEERMKKVGIFKKQEDYAKKEEFIHEYKKKHLESSIREAFDRE